MKAIEHPLMLILICTVVTFLQVTPRPAGGQELAESDAGYIDAASVGNQIRFRFDAGYDNPIPDRAEFFYPQIGVGPPLPESRVDYQELEAAAEFVLMSHVSAFVEVPVRFINPEVNANDGGLSDVRAGFKCVLHGTASHTLTFQLRGYFPSGDDSAGLGTGHVSLEPGLLFQVDDDRLHVFGELKGWIPIGGSVVKDPANFFNGRRFSGTILRYGLGMSYDVFLQGNQFHLCESCRMPVDNRVSVVGELVGWTILDGLKTNSGTDDTASAINDTIVNVKVGLRWTRPRDSFYVGYGTALTRDVWYENIARAEYAIRF